ncbi:TPA: 30S ribosomal protein S5 [Candidatus Woesearchaeota archaeon]|nr:Ribosomal protein S5 [archaeon GW2011_AR15]MBS3103845.1 30S ribosomal protein S5 [Candidatus Woesearchaeota archaeon]HIH40829.1 30S ribosomal protein S5 [Candidatus Woesearchaeota archaeon]
MAKKITKPEEVEEIEAIAEFEDEATLKTARDKKVEELVWTPRTGLGKKVASGELRDIYTILDRGEVIMEKEIIDVLLPDIESDLLQIGQAKGKFGGGKRRVFRQTQKKTKEGNKPRFATLAVVGNRKGIIGLGYGKAKETVPAREKAARNAKFNVFKIRRGCGSWECGCGEAHSLPFKIKGKCGSAELILMPAPKGTGLKVDREIARILDLAGIKDVWSQTNGQTTSKLNLIKAAERALKTLTTTKLQEKHYKILSISERPEEKKNG